MGVIGEVFPCDGRDVETPCSGPPGLHVWGAPLSRRLPVVIVLREVEQERGGLLWCSRKCGCLTVVAHVHGGILWKPGLFSEVPGESSVVVKSVVVVEVTWYIRSLEEDKEQSSRGPHDPGILVLGSPLPGPAKEVLNQGARSVLEVDGERQVEGRAERWVVRLWCIRAVDTR